jgi:hypothetical protein
MGDDRSALESRIQMAAKDTTTAGKVLSANTVGR